MATGDGLNLAQEEMLTLLAEGSALCTSYGRHDLVHLLEIAVARMRRPSTVICVVGEFKQGKSQIVNALVGHTVCPVDDDTATSTISVIGHSVEAAAFVHRSENGKRIIDEIDPADVPRFAAGAEDQDAGARVDMIELTVPSENLERGLTLVDTPGVNAFRSGADRAVLDFLRYVDCLLLVTDASAELSPPELRFLKAARDGCPSVLVALSKVDLYPEWRRIATLNAEHLAAVGLTADILLPISSTLQLSGVERENHRLQDESGVAGLMAAVESGVVEPAHRMNRQRAAGDLDRVIHTIRSIENDRVAALEDASRGRERLAELQEVQRAVSLMGDASSRWLVTLNDGISDVRAKVDYRFRTAMRRHLQNSDRRLSEANPAEIWDELCGELRASLGADVDQVFQTVREGTDQIADRIAKMIAEDVEASLDASSESIDLEHLWLSEDRSLTPRDRNLLQGGLNALRGGYSGMLMLGMLSQLAGIAALGGISVGVGVLFGAKQIRDERRRNLERQRQEARTVMRQFLEEAQLEVGTQLQRAIQESHRLLRDHFGDRIKVLSATRAASVRRLEEALDADEARRLQLLAEAKSRIGTLNDLAARLAAETAEE